MTIDVHARARADYAYRALTGVVGLKVNLYTSLDVAALDAAVATMASDKLRLECVMVGDSILVTHHGRESTQLSDGGSQRWARGILAEALTEVSGALRRSGRLKDVYLMADLPEGSLASTARLIGTAESFLAAGADAVKLEVEGVESLWAIESLASAGLAVFAHLGYTPQSARLRRYGKTPHERQALYQVARCSRDGGACGLVLEMVDPVASAALSTPSPVGLPCFSIFSGPSVWGGGLSINSWDAVFRHSSGVDAFPPTAFLDRSDFAKAYTVQNVTRGVTELLRLVSEKRFPLPVDGRATVPDSSLEDPWNAPPS